jgi:glutamine amidotransferase
MIGVIDYGIGNLRSVQKALQRAGAQAELVTTAAAMARAQKIVLPGVAAFSDAMAQLRRRGLLQAVRDAIRDAVPYLGLCLGLQLLFETSSEDGRHAGLGVLAGEAVRFDPPAGPGGKRLAVPHMGWNQLHIRRPSRMLDGLADGDYVYFAHSYHVVPADETVVVTTTDYGYEFVSSVEKANVFATQFHPEKSQAVGLRLLENFVRL